MKLSNSPSQGQPNPRKAGLKVAFGPLLWHFGHFFPQPNIFSWVRIGFIEVTEYKKPNPTEFSATLTPLSTDM